MLGSISVLGGSYYMVVVTLGIIGMMLGNFSLFNNGGIDLLIISSLFVVVWGVVSWIHEWSNESILGEDTEEEGTNMWQGIITIIVTELVIIANYIWFYIYNGLNTDKDVVTWPPFNIDNGDIEVVLINTVFLLTTGVTITVAVNHMEFGNNISVLLWMWLTVIFGSLIVGVQVVEYVMSEYCINDSIYGSIIISLTGLHGLHVIIGMLFIVNSIISINSNEYTIESNEGLDISVIYWHMVDAIWLIVVVIFYLWGGQVFYTDTIESWSIVYQDYGSIDMAMMDEMNSIIWIYLLIVMVKVVWWLVNVSGNYSYNKVEEPNIEMIWTIVPSVIIGLIVGPSVSLINWSNNEGEITVKVISNQWIWEYEINNNNEVISNSISDSISFMDTDNSILIPVDVDISVITTSNDVMHSISVPSLGIKMDCIPGSLNESNISVISEGVYYGQCAELCGVDHSAMPIVVEAVSIDKYLGL